MASRSRARTTPRRSDTADPSAARERALRILFQADLRGVEPSVTLARVEADEDARALLDERESLSDEAPILPEQVAAAAGPGDVVSGPSRRTSDSTRSGTGSAAGPGTGATARSGAGSVGRPPGSVSGWSEVSSAEVAPIDGFTRTLVLGVERDRSDIEGLITRYSRRWAISRMPVVDRNVLRLATYELLRETTPPAVVLDEAIGLAKRLSTDDSGRFVNGVLESIRQDIARTRAAEAAETPTD